jgi:predicted dienelactone hydrolase
MESDPVLYPQIMPGKAAAVGFFLGGTSALALGGARLDANSYGRSCDRPKAGVDCAWFAKNGVDLKEIDTSSLSRSHRDERIKAVIAVDPELSTSFAPESLAGIRIPVDIINLGSPDTIAPALEATGLKALIPDSRYHSIPDATSFSAFSPCTAGGPALLREEGDDDAICLDGGTRPRKKIHRDIAMKIADALHRSLSERP